MFLYVLRGSFCFFEQEKKLWSKNRFFMLNIWKLLVKKITNILFSNVRNAVFKNNDEYQDLNFKIIIPAHYLR